MQEKMGNAPEARQAGLESQDGRVQVQTTRLLCTVPMYDAGSTASATWEGKLPHFQGCPRIGQLNQSRAM